MDLTGLDLMKFIPNYMIILLVAAYVLGTILKNASIVKDKYIPLILGVLCITIAILLVIINGQYKVIYEAIITGLLQGIIIWGVAIGVNQTVKQLNKYE